MDDYTKNQQPTDAEQYETESPTVKPDTTEVETLSGTTTKSETHTDAHGAGAGLGQTFGSLFGGGEDTPDSGTMLIVTFDDESKAYHALGRVKEMARERQIKVTNAMLIRRDESDKLKIVDGISTELAGATGLKGGTIGAMVGILGGPLGVLLGWGAGSMIGSAMDVKEVMRDRSVFQQVADALPHGKMGLIIEADDASDAKLDPVLTELGGEIMRKPVAEIQAQVMSAERAQTQAQAQAMKSMAEERFGTLKDDVMTNTEGLRGKLKDAMKLLGEVIEGEPVNRNRSTTTTTSTTTTSTSPVNDTTLTAEVSPVDTLNKVDTETFGEPSSTSTETLSNTDPSNKLS